MIMQTHFQSKQVLAKTTASNRIGLCHAIHSKTRSDPGSLLNLVVLPSPAKQHTRRFHTSEQRRTVIARCAIAPSITVQSVTTALLHASRAWDKYDADNSGTLNIDEVVELLNG